jgi:aspartate ammonia-lyase
MRCSAHLDASVATATALVPLIGYNKSAELARTALQIDKTVRQLALERQIVTAETMHLLDPLALARPQRADQTQENSHQIGGIR